MLEGLVNREEFLVIDFVVQLRGEHRPRVVRDRVKVVVAGCHLQQYGGDRVVRPVGLDDNGVRGVKVREDGSGGECILQRFEGRLALWTPNKGGVFPRDSVHWCDDVQVVRYESPIEVSETQEGLDVLDITRRRPVVDDLRLGGIHREATRRHNET